MSEGIPPPCKDFEVCGNQSDPRYTMDFTDVKPGAFIHWCATCGPIWHDVNDVLQAKFDDDPAFASKFKDEMDSIEEENNQ